MASAGSSAVVPSAPRRTASRMFSNERIGHRCSSRPRSRNAWTCWSVSPSKPTQIRDAPVWSTSFSQPPSNSSAAAMSWRMMPRGTSGNSSMASRSGSFLKLVSWVRAAWSGWSAKYLARYGHGLRVP